MEMDIWLLTQIGSAGCAVGQKQTVSLTGVACYYCSRKPAAFTINYNISEGF